MDPAEIVIAPMTLACVEQFHACLDAVARERRYLAFVEAPPLENVRRFIRDNLEHNVPQMIALEGDRVIGWCDIQRNVLEGFHHCGWLGIGLLPTYRDRQLGVRLFEAAFERARALGIWRVEVEVFASNVRAIRFYQKLGFRLEGRKRHARLLDGAFDDLLCMALLVEPSATSARNA